MDTPLLSLMYFCMFWMKVSSSVLGRSCGHGQAPYIHTTQRGYQQA